MKWVTWENVGVDRISSAWLIARFIDPEAEFRFIRKGERISEADGTPFDVPGVRLTHRRGHCTFCTILKEYELKDPVLDRLGAVIDAADTVHDLLPPPEAAGVDLIFRGLRKVTGDDFKALETGFVIMDALYRQLSDEL
jgi:hypothetical protein